ncbi:MAG: Gfo/Idh/MocA family oxidoreductase [Neisseriales bacterium]|nr:MAG: Gfo/Idh/MocA family oxidoreductase [Neisseriales bacterium]
MSQLPVELIKQRPIRFALVGCGRIAANHIKALTAFPNEADLVDICDVNRDALQAVQQQMPVNIYADLEALLERTTADVAILATPSGLHAPQAIRCLSRGLHVVSEKPMATLWQDGLAMVKAADDAQRLLFVVKQNRHNATLQLLKQALETGRFGRIFMVTINVFWYRPQSYYDLASWRGTWQLDGGALMNQASHYVDLLTWLLGPVESVQAYTATLARDIEAEDTGAVSIRWCSGALGSINVTMLTYPKNFEGSITVIGEKGTVRIGGVAVNRIQHWEFSEPSLMDEQAKAASYDTNSVYGFGHTCYYKNVIDVFKGRTQPYTDGKEGLKSLELLTAMYRSAKMGQKISLPLER